MDRVNFTQYDEYPREMLMYLRYNGPHFNKRLCEFAVDHMSRDGKKVLQKTKDYLDELLTKYNVEIQNNQLYDGLYVFHMGIADFYKSSIQDEKSLALYVKDVLDDTDAVDGLVFNRWYADMCYKGIAIPWDEVL